MQLYDGSVIFIQGGPLVKPISKRTDSPLTHAAIIFYDNGWWVYEAVPPRVHRVQFAEYLSSLKTASHHSWFMLEPRVPYSADELRAMKQYADEQIARRYMVRGWWKHQETRGIFCSEYVGNIIEQSGRMISAHYRESPGSLYEKLDFYAPTH